MNEITDITKSSSTRQFAGDDHHYHSPFFSTTLCVNIKLFKQAPRQQYRWTILRSCSRITEFIFQGSNFCEILAQLTGTTAGTTKIGLLGICDSSRRLSSAQNVQPNCDRWGQFRLLGAEHDISTEFFKVGRLIHSR